MEPFGILSAADLAALITTRPGETKLGEQVHTVEQPHEISGCSARFVLVGLPEDIGVRANLGVGGAASAWEPSLQALLNVQATDRLTGRELLVLGAFNFSDLTAEGGDVEGLRAKTEIVDESVAIVIEKIVRGGKVPVVIGGGHNNAYPIIQGVARAKGKMIHCINLDAHSDYRAAEGRHSGNGFRYARRDGFLDRYAAVGLHENYNSREIIAEISRDPAIHHSFYEDIFIREEQTFRQAVTQAIRHTEGGPCGIELDLDCIAGVLSSAETPCGITTLQARQYVSWCAAETEVAYLHITEGAVRLQDGRTDASTAKLIAYLVTDFLKAAH